MTTFRVLEISPGASGFVPRLRAPLIGRDAELRLLEGAFRETMEARACQMALVLGEPGIGKSRLVAEFAASVADDALVVRGRCPSYGEGITYFPIVEVIRAAVQIAEDDPPEVVREKLRAVVNGQSAGSLAEILQLPGALARPRQSFRAVGQLLESLAEDRPLLVVLDDLHWAASMLLDLIEHVATRSRGPILLVCMARPELDEIRPTWRSAVATTRVELAPLDPSAAHELVAALLGGAVPEDVPSSVVETADGNPLYVEELVAMLIDRRILARGADGWVRTAALPDTSVPPTLQALLQARLELLPPLELAVLEVGSIEGKSFHTGTVLSLAGEEVGAEDLGPALDALLGRDFVRPDRPVFADEHAFRFRHQLIRDAAYARVPKARRATLHERLADRLEREGHQVPEPDAILGYHLEQAYRLRAELGNTGIELEALGARAAAKLASAGRLAGDRGDDVAAVNLLERAAALSTDGRDRAARLIEASDLLLWAYRDPEARDAAARAAAIARSVGERSMEAQAECIRMMAMSFSDERSLASDLRAAYEAAEPVLEGAGDEVGLVRVLLVRSQHLESECRFAEEVAVLRKALALAERNRLRRSSAVARYLLAGAYVLGPEPVGEAVSRCRELLEADPGNPVLEFGITWRMGYLEAMAGRIGAAHELLERATNLGEEAALEGPLRNLFYFRGELEWVAGDLAVAERWFRECLATARAEANLGLAGWMATALGLVLIEQERVDEAEPFIAIAEEVTPQDDVSEGIRLRMGQSGVASWHGALATAETAAREAVRLARSTESPELQGCAERALADVLLARGRPADAVAMLRRAVASFEHKGIVHWAAAARATLDRLT